MDSITEQECGHFLEVRDIFCFSPGLAVESSGQPGSGAAGEGGSDGSALTPLMLQPAAMHASASRKPTVMPILGSLDPSGLTISRPRPYQVEVSVRKEERRKDIGPWEVSVSGA